MNNSDQQNTIPAGGRYIASTIICLLYATMVWADTTPPRFKQIDMKLKDDSYIISATVQYTLSDTVIEALHHGISLEVSTSLQAVKIVPWWLDGILHKKHARRRLGYHIISNQYVVTDPLQQTQNSYYDLARALQALGTLNWQIPVSHIDYNTDKIQLQMRSQVDVNHLPLLLQLVARINPDWRKLLRPVTYNMPVQ